MGEFNQSQIIDILKGFWYKITNDIGGDRLGSRRKFEEGYYKLGFSLRKSQVYV